MIFMENLIELRNMEKEYDLGVFFGVLVGILAGYFPARKAAKLQPVDALRYE